MEENQEVEKIRKVRRLKDGDTRDRNGRWAGKVVTLRVEHYALVEEWQKQSGMKKSYFWREALMRGVVDLMKSYGVEASFPPVEQIPYVYTPKKRYIGWLFRKGKK